ncbi:MAG TPA: hypothetical protein VHD36_11435 [Pirellulales bacterium]|nr:hypothetical protein [Pirellulales bacterium]
MSERAWLDELRAQLARTKLPAAYAARLFEELSDHVTDFMEDQMSTDALPSRGLMDRLGAPLDVVECAQREFRRRSFSGRHPILIFVVLPLVVLQLGYAASLFSVVGTGGILKKLDPAMSSELLSPGGTALIELLCGGLMLASATLTAALFAWLAARAGVNRRWPIITGAIMGLLAGLTQMSVYISPNPGQSRLSLGLGFGTSMALFQVARFAVPLAIGLWIFARRMHREPAVLAS